MRNTLVIEVERGEKKYMLVTPNDPNIGELIDVCSEIMAHCFKLVDDLKKETEKKKKEAEDNLSTLIATQPKEDASVTQS
jgi:hypothetical protein